MIEGVSRSLCEQLSRVQTLADAELRNARRNNTSYRRAQESPLPVNESANAGGNNERIATEVLIHMENNQLQFCISLNFADANYRLAEGFLVEKGCHSRGRRYPVAGFDSGTFVQGTHV